MRALARWLNAAARELAAAGAGLLQIDEPFLAGYPEAVELAIEAVNIVTDGVDGDWALHVCYGNRYARPLWEGHYDFLFPAVLAAQVDQLVLEFARKGPGDLSLLQGIRVGSRRRAGRDRREDRRHRDDGSGRRRGSAVRSTSSRRTAWSSTPIAACATCRPAVARAKLRALVTGAGQVREELLKAGTGR